MPRFPLPWRAWTTIAACAVQTAVAAFAAFRWVESGSGVAAVVLFGSWAALALAGMISGGAAGFLAAYSTPSTSPIDGQAPPEPDPWNALLLKYGALLPLCQVLVGAVIAALASLGGFTVAESVFIGPGVGGAVGTVAMIALGAYLALLCGVILVLVTVVPVLMLWHVARGESQGRTPKWAQVTAAATALILLVLFPSAIGAVLAVAAPDGVSPRGTTYGLMLTVLGFDLSDRGYTVQHRGWLWFARICGAVILLAIAAAVLAGRSSRTSPAGARPRPSRDRDRRRSVPSPRPRRRAGNRPSTRKKRKKRR